MRMRIVRRLLSAAAGVVVLAGSAAAQDRTPAYPVTTAPAGQYTPAQHAVAIPSTPAAATAAQVGPGPGAVIVQGSGGCTNCGTGAAGGHGYVMSHAAGGYYKTDCPNASRCNNGCGSLKADMGTLFGSCRSFFKPCGPGLGGCHSPVGGTGPCGPFDTCKYDSYLNH